MAAIFSGVAPAVSDNFVTIDVPGSTSTVARGISNLGEIVGTDTRENKTLGFIYSGGTFSNLEVPDATITNPNGINRAGQIVGFYNFADNVRHAFLYAGGSFSTVDVPGATAAEALAINDLGELVGTFTDARGEHGFLYLGGNFTTLDVPGASSTSAEGIDNAGEIVGTYTAADSVVRGFRYTGGVYSNREVPEGGQPYTLGINDSGQVVGYYLDGSGVAHGFLGAVSTHTSLTADGTNTGGLASLHGAAPAVITGRPTARTGASAGVCDISGNGTIDVTDASLIVSQALGNLAAANDQNGDHVVNVADIQSVIDAVLRQSCTLGVSPVVTHLTVQSGNGQVNCPACISATLQAFQPISVKATDASGNPVAGATVSWSVTSGQIGFANSATSATSTTDSNGIASAAPSLFLPSYFTTPFAPYLVSTIQATSNSISTVFTETMDLINGGGIGILYANQPTIGGVSLNNPISANTGATLPTPMQVQVAAYQVASAGLPIASIRIVNQQSSPSLSCANQGGNADPGSVLSDSFGNSNCYLVFSGSGTGSFYVLFGAVPATSFATALYQRAFGPYSFTSGSGSNSGAPTAVQIISGNNQAVNTGLALNPLIAKLVDAGGNAVQGQTMTWTVVPAGAATLNLSNLVTDNNGEVSITGTLGPLASAGANITVALASNPSISATFNETIPNPLTSLTKVSGDGQTASVGTDFGNLLVVKLVYASGPAQYFTLPLQVSGVPVSLIGGNPIYTDANGQASVKVHAGSTAGTVTVTATAGLLTTTFTLTVQ